VCHIVTYMHDSCLSAIFEICTTCAVIELTCYAYGIHIFLTVTVTFVTTFNSVLTSLIEYLSSMRHVYHLVAHMHNSYLSQIIKLCIGYAIVDATNYV